MMTVLSTGYEKLRLLNLKQTNNCCVSFYKLIQILRLYIKLGYIYNMFFWEQLLILCSFFEIQRNEEEMLLVGNNVKDRMYACVYVCVKVKLCLHVHDFL